MTKAFILVSLVAVASSASAEIDLSFRSSKKRPGSSETAKATGAANHERGTAKAERRTDSTELNGHTLMCVDEIEIETQFRICVYTTQVQRLNFSFDVDRATRKLTEVAARLYERKPGSLVHQINRAAGAQSVGLNKDTYSLVKEAFTLAAETDGAYDPTWLPVFDLYSFKKGESEEPIEGTLKNLLPLVNFKEVEFKDDKQSVYLKKSGMRMSLKPFAQGLAIDAVAQELRKKYPSGFIEAGYRGFYWGGQPDGSHWKVVFKDPRETEKVLAEFAGKDFALTVLQANDQAFLSRGQKIHPHLDARTGKPATISQGVAILSEKAITSSILALPAFVVGPDKAAPLLEKHGAKGILVSNDKVIFTKGLEKPKVGTITVSVAEADKVSVQ